MTALDYWSALVEAVRNYSRHAFGDEPFAITIHLARSKSAKLPLPPPCPLLDHVERPDVGREGEQVGSNRGATGECDHSEDFRIVIWWGRRWELGAKQAKVVERLWRAYHEETIKDVGQEELLRYCDSDGTRLYDLFRGSEALGGLIASVGQGRYRLADPPERFPAPPR